MSYTLSMCVYCVCLYVVGWTGSSVGWCREDNWWMCQTSQDTASDLSRHVASFTSVLLYIATSLSHTVTSLLTLVITRVCWLVVVQVQLLEIWQWCCASQKLRYISFQEVKVKVQGQSHCNADFLIVKAWQWFDRLRYVYQIWQCKILQCC